MKLKTTYLGLELNSPIIVSSSTLTGSVESIKHCAEAGAGAIILKSIFEEQISSEIKREEGYTDEDIYDLYPEAQEYLNTYMRGSEIEIYEKLIRESKKVVDIPVIASINCSDEGEWIKIARELQAAGADALELNIAIAAFDRDIDPRKIEEEYVNIFTWRACAFTSTGRRIIQPNSPTRPGNSGRRTTNSARLTSSGWNG